jgi:hypothetical protein
MGESARVATIQNPVAKIAIDMLSKTNPNRLRECLFLDMAPSWCAFGAG